MAGFNGDLDARDNVELRRVLADEMPDTFRWLLQHGVRFYGPMPEPPHSKPRMHNVLPNSRAFITHLARAARRAGVTIACGVRAIALVAEQGRVVGVDCATASGPRRFRARGGVVLAAGDFTSDPELKAQFMGPQEAKIDGVNVTATGDGQKLALALGARIVNGDLALGPELRFVPPPGRNMLLMLPPWRLLANLMAWSLEHMPSALLRPFAMSFVTTALAPSPDLFVEGALLINKRGERFTDERDKPAYALPDQPDKVAYILLDSRMAAMFSGWPYFISTAPGVAYAYVDDYRRNRADIFNTGATLGEGPRAPARARGHAASKLAMPAAALAGNRWRAQCQRRQPAAVRRGPYVAFGPLRAVFVHAEAGWRSTANIACWVKETNLFPASMPPARPGRVACCSRATAIISAGPSPPASRAGRNAARASFPSPLVGEGAMATRPCLIELRVSRPRRLFGFDGTAGGAPNSLTVLRDLVVGHPRPSPRP